MGTAPYDVGAGDVPTTGHAPTARPLVVRGLGVFSLVLGSVQLVRPGHLARWIGLDDDDGTRAVLRVVGGRELSVVPGLLAGSAPTGWLWARVGGDAMDLALLGRALLGKGGGNGRRRAVAATAAVAGVTVVDLLATRRTKRAGGSATTLTAAVTVNRPADEVYSYWRDFENLPVSMQHIKSVQTLADGRSHWVETGEVVRSDGSPGGTSARRQIVQRPAHPVAGG